MLPKNPRVLRHEKEENKSASFKLCLKHLKRFLMSGKGYKQNLLPKFLGTYLVTNLVSFIFL